MSPAEQSAAASQAAQAQEAPSLLDQVIAATRPQSDKEAERARDYFKQFLGSVEAGPGRVQG